MNFLTVIVGVITLLIQYNLKNDISLTSVVISWVVVLSVISGINYVFFNKFQIWNKE
jgi:hypothetical protein